METSDQNPPSSDQRSNAAPSASSSGTAGYEFTAGENAVIGNLASKMLFVGIAVLVASVLIVLFGIARHDLAHVVSALIYLCIGSLTITAAASFKNVVRTQGDDISFLMNALDKLRLIYTIQYWFILIAIALVVVFVVLGSLAR